MGYKPELLERGIQGGGGKSEENYPYSFLVCRVCSWFSHLQGNGSRNSGYLQIKSSSPEENIEIRKISTN